MNGLLYTNKEICMIREYAGVKSAAEIGQLLGRPKGSIENRASKEKISLCLGEYRLKHSAKDEAVIREYAGTKTAAEIGIMIGRSQAAVWNKARALGVCLKKVGEDHYKAKLSNLQVEMINALLVSGFKPHEIHKAAFNHVHYNTVQSVTSCWSRITK